MSFADARKFDSQGSGSAAVALGTMSRRSVPDYEGQNCSGTNRVSTDELVDFVKVRALKKTIKEIAHLTGLSEKAVKNLRLGTAGASAQTISTWCRNDPQFRAEYFYWLGGHLEVEPETVAALSIAVNRILQSQQHRVAAE